MVAGHFSLNELKENGLLPSPKGAAMHIFQLCQSENVSKQEVVHAIQSDPALSSRLIKLANSPASYQVRPIVSIEDAVTVLGLNTIRQIVLGLSLIDSTRQLNCTNFNYEYFWQHSLLTAIAAQNLAVNGCPNIIPQEEIFVLGLLSHVGILALATAYPEEYSRILSLRAKNQNISLCEMEQSQFGFDHNKVSRELFADWRMPSAFLNVVQYFEDPQVSGHGDASRDWCLLQLLHVADHFARMSLAEPQIRSRMMSRLVFKATRLGIESGYLLKLGDKVVLEWEDWSRIFQFRVPKLPSMSSMIEMAPLVPEIDEISNFPPSLVTAYKLRILVVDDDNAILMLLKAWLDMLGHTVALAKDGKEGLQQVQHFRPQLILTDWMMPEMNGIEFCKALRANPYWRNIYVFMLTSQESADRLVEAFEAGANDYMTKPLNPKILGARLHAGLRVVQLQEELEHDREQLRKFSIELAESNKRLQQLALTDDLTGIYNRRAANDHLVRLWAAAERGGGGLSCMLIDIDLFKNINDTYGHQAGDEALKQVSKALQFSIRKQDIVSRHGGEEFLVISPDSQAEMLFRYAERLRLNVAGHPIAVGDGKEIRLTISIGAVAKNSALQSPEAMLQLADKRLYAAKAKGRNCTVAE